MNNAILRSKSLTASYTPLVSEPLVATAVVTSPTSNAGTIYLKGDDGSDVPWQPGEWHEFHHVDLHALEAKADNPGDVLTVNGGSW